MCSRWCPDDPRRRGPHRGARSDRCGPGCCPLQARHALIQRGGQWVLQKRGWLWGWRAANTASDADRLRKAVQEARAAYKHKVTPGRRTHILDGDATGGGHRAGTGRPSKTEFPDCWSDDYIKDLIEDIANGKLGTCVTRPDGRKECKALVDGYEILVVVENEDTGMHIVTAYPLRNAKCQPNP
ncbi:MAG: EndoU domain-containing protein [Phycisphaerales bacterium]|nr:EndoU domain-containing protein [Phycisphaerales bacterium]